MTPNTKRAEAAPPQAGGMSRATRLGWIVLGIVVAATLWWIVDELAASDNGMSGQGWIALVLGTIGTCALAGVLMWLLFRSADDDERRRTL